MKEEYEERAPVREEYNDEYEREWAEEERRQRKRRAPRTPAPAARPGRPRKHHHTRRADEIDGANPPLHLRVRAKDALRPRQ